MKKIIISGIALIATGIYFVSCTNDKLSDVTGCENSVIKYSSAADSLNVQNILDDKCASCHDGSGGAPGNLTTLAGYRGLRGQVRNFVIESRGSGNQMPPVGSADLTEAEYAKVRCWILNDMPE